MTNQEAIENLKGCIVSEEWRDGKPTGYVTCDLTREILSMAIAALEKQEPKVPPEISWEYDYFKCPSCGKLITSTTGIDAHKYCLECGQALKFTEVAKNDKRRA